MIVECFSKYIVVENELFFRGIWRTRAKLIQVYGSSPCSYNFTYRPLTPLLFLYCPEPDDYYQKNNLLAKFCQNETRRGTASGDRRMGVRRSAIFHVDTSTALRGWGTWLIYAPEHLVSRTVSEVQEPRIINSKPAQNKEQR